MISIFYVIFLQHSHILMYFLYNFVSLHIDLVPTVVLYCIVLYSFHTQGLISTLLMVTYV